MRRAVALLNVRIIGNHIHVKALGATSHELADRTEPDDAQCFAGQLRSGGTKPLVRLGLPIQIRDATDERQNQPHRQLSHSLRVDTGRVGDGDAQRLRSSNIHTVVADAVTRYYLQLFACAQHLFCYKVQTSKVAITVLQKWKQFILRQRAFAGVKYQLWIGCTERFQRGIFRTGLK